MVPSLLYIRADSLLTFRMTEQFCAEPGSRLKRDRPSRAREWLLWTSEKILRRSYNLLRMTREGGGDGQLLRMTVAGQSNKRALRAPFLTARNNRARRRWTTRHGPWWNRTRRPRDNRGTYPSKEYRNGRRKKAATTRNNASTPRNRAG